MVGPCQHLRIGVLMRRPFAGRFSITGDRGTHAEYGVGPATDYGLPEGTPVLAPWAGTASTYATGSGGTTIELDGEAVLVAQHLSAVLVSGPVREGQVIAQSGRSGTPPPATGLTTYDPHLHAYVRVAGVRLALEEYFAARGFAAGALGDVVPGTLLTAAGLPTAFPEEDTMAQMYFRHADTGAIGVFGAGPAPAIFASIEEYHAWRGLLLAWNAKNPAHEVLVPPGEAIADQLVNVDDVGWGVLMRVHSASVDPTSAPALTSSSPALAEDVVAAIRRVWVG